MDYFDSMIDFKTNADGEIIYFPNSFFGKSFIVPSIEKKHEIQKVTKRIWKIYFFMIVLGATGFGASIALSSGVWRWLFSISILMILIGFAIWAQRSIKSLAHGLVESSVKISILESYTNTALSMNFISLLLLETTSCWIVFSAFQIAKNPQFFPWLYKPVGILTVLFFGFASIVIAYMIIVKIKRAFAK